MSLILVIEDDKLVRFTIRQTLEGIGHQIIEAANGRLGVKSFAEHGADLVITDIIMPEMEGIETIAALRKLSAGCKIIATTGGGRTGVSEHLRSATLAGADDTLPKPFDNDILIEKVNRLLPDCPPSAATQP